MVKYKLYALFFIIIGFGVAGVYFVSEGYYPVAMVNGSFITAKTFVDEYSITSAYYNNVIKAYNSAVSSSGNNGSSNLPALTPDQLRQSALSALVENILIERGAMKETGGNLERLVMEKVNQATGNSDMKKAVETIYGLNIDDFKKKVLIPQAERDILTGALFLKGQKIEDWLAAEKKASRVLIFSGKFYWDGEKVISK